MWKVYDVYDNITQVIKVISYNVHNNIIQVIKIKLYTILDMENYVLTPLDIINQVNRIVHQVKQLSIVHQLLLVHNSRYSIVLVQQNSMIILYYVIYLLDISINSNTKVIHSIDDFTINIDYFMIDTDYFSNNSFIMIICYKIFDIFSNNEIYFITDGKEIFCSQ